MKNGLVNKDLIMKAWVFLRGNEHTIPNETLDFMRDCAIREITRHEEIVCPECPIQRGIVCKGRTRCDWSGKECGPSDNCGEWEPEICPTCHGTGRVTNEN